jgi:hypothetical protein
MAEFKVVLEGVDLDDEQTARVQSAVQKSVLHALADLDLQGDRAAVLIPRFGPGIRGLIALLAESRNLVDTHATAEKIAAREFQR